MDRYSLWLLPEDPTSARLGRLIERLSTECGGPVFTPHITLLGSITATNDVLVARTERLATAVPVLALTFDGIAYRPEYYRALFAIVTADAALSQAHLAATRLFPGAGGTGFMPHLSLLYGDYPEALKRRLAATLKDAVAGPLRCDRLALYRTEGSVSRWDCLHSTHLSNA